MPLHNHKVKYWIKTSTFWNASHQRHVFTVITLLNIGTQGSESWNCVMLELRIVVISLETNDRGKGWVIIHTQAEVPETF